MSERPLIYLVVPSGGMWCEETGLSLLGMQREFFKRGIEMDFYLEGQRGDVYLARNLAHHEFLKSPATHLLFIDADQQFDADAVLGMIESGHDVVGCTYPKKRLHWGPIIEAAKAGHPEPERFGLTYTFNPLANQTTLRHERGCIPVDSLGTGMLLISRAAAEKMVEEYAHLWLWHPRGEQSGERFHFLFDSPLAEGETHDRHYRSEDITYCRRWRRTGNDVWMYIWANVNHVGKYVYRGAIHEVIRLHETESDCEAAHQEEVIARKS